MNNCATPTPSYTVGQFLGETAYLLLLTVSFVIVMWQIPSFTARRFGGFGELGQEWSNSVQRYVISKVFRPR